MSSPPDPNPSLRFEDILTDPKLIETLTVTLGFKNPTPIQQSVIPPILGGKDVYGGAKTGSGKTIAFLAPIIELIRTKKIKRALVLVPTRELALQIDDEAMRLANGDEDLVSVPLFGGVPVDPQILALRHHDPKLLIATPGRTMDLIQEGALQLPEIEVSVLDEADRMCDMGFAPQVTGILDMLMNRKQMLLFSATLPKELNEIMMRFSPDPVRIQIDASDASSDTIEHIAVYTTRQNKVATMTEIVSDPDRICVVFTRTRKRADEIHRKLTQKKVSVGILHAGYSMPERERTARAFKDGKFRCLVTTDVFARGIDIDTITHVIHYDIPDALEDYIHRSGRSGRAGRSGTTMALVDSHSRDEMALIKRFSEKIKFQTFYPEKEKTQRPEGSRQRDSRRQPDQRKMSSKRHHQKRHRPRPHAEHRPSSRPAPEKPSLVKRATNFLKSIFSN